VICQESSGRRTRWRDCRTRAEPPVKMHIVRSTQRGKGHTRSRVTLNCRSGRQEVKTRTRQWHSLRVNCYERASKSLRAYTGGQGVPGSNPGIPTNVFRCNLRSARWVDCRIGTLQAQSIEAPEVQPPFLSLPSCFAPSWTKLDGATWLATRSSRPGSPERLSGVLGRRSSLRIGNLLPWLGSVSYFSIPRGLTGF
jgi:hypothetical protein